MPCNQLRPIHTEDHKASTGQTTQPSIMPNAHHFNLPLIPKFLLPPTVFRSRQSAGGDSSQPNDHELSKSEKYLDGHVSYLRCSRCAADICLASQIVSKGFNGQHGRAYLVSPEPVASAISVSASSSPTVSLPNTILQKPVWRQLVTGGHTVSDMSCASCGSVLGWKYVAADEESQRYKVGKFILETKKITASSCWESPPRNIGSAAPFGTVNSGNSGAKTLDEDISFDSQDEDECEDLFAGIWNPDLAMRRRSRKPNHRSAVFGLG